MDFNCVLCPVCGKAHKAPICAMTQDRYGIAKRLPLPYLDTKGTDNGYLLQVADYILTREQSIRAENEKELTRQARFYRGAIDILEAKISELEGKIKGHEKELSIGAKYYSSLFLANNEILALRDKISEARKVLEEARKPYKFLDGPLSLTPPWIDECNIESKVSTSLWKANKAAIEILK